MTTTIRSVADSLDAVLQADMLDQSPARVEAMQHLLDQGLAWRLNSYVGMVAEWMIAEGLCQPGPCRQVSRCGRKVTP